MSSVLLVIDAQRNMLLPPEPVPDASSVGAAIERTIAAARSAGVRVVHIRNTGDAGDPDEPGTPGWELVSDVRDGEPVVDKPECDAFIGTDLADHVPAGTPLVLVGMQSEHCVRETALGALARAHPVTLVRGAHATYPDGEPASGISARVETELARAGVRVVEPTELAFD
ncbi:MAG TPA: isochorismatase family protein [Pseudonocardiaceae bacterium]|jgi:nicotinamidase-related amidase|nr:isochorismatase family protein [Pseudonocardiaceae bacterium]